MDKQKPKFDKGGKFSKLHSVFTGFESFLFVPNRTTDSGAHIRDAVDLKRTMIIVVLALIPALLFGIYNVGYQHFNAIGELEQSSFWQLFFYGLWKVLPMIVVSYVVGLGIEFAVAQVKGHEINEGFLVSGLLIPMIMPVEAPLWMIALSTAFAVIIGKEIFGGTGMNIWNPALLARAFFFFSYPSMISGDKVWIASDTADAISQATPLAQMALGQEVTYSMADMFWGFIPGSIGETSTFCILIGAVILLLTKMGNWRCSTGFAYSPAISMLNALPSFSSPLELTMYCSLMYFSNSVAEASGVEVMWIALRMFCRFSFSLFLVCAGCRDSETTASRAATTTTRTIEYKIVYVFPCLSIVSFTFMILQQLLPSSVCV